MTPGKFMLAIVGIVVVIACLGFIVISAMPAFDAAAPTANTSATVIATRSVPPAGADALEPQVMPAKPGFRPAFDDEFVARRIDPSRWATSLPWGNAPQAEIQYYTPSALKLADGVLTLTASQQAMGGRPYTSGAMCTTDRFVFTYGYSEIRAKVPAGDGLWSAFWLVSPEQDNRNEADIMEILGADPLKGQSVLHYGTNEHASKYEYVYRGPDFSTSFHTFALDWEPNSMIWYVDGVERHRVTENIPSTPMFIVANLAVGAPGSWAGTPTRYTQFPAQLKVDYVRVYQRR